MGIARQTNSMQTTRTPAGSSENGLSDVISQIPFAPFSLFLNGKSDCQFLGGMAGLSFS